MEMNRIKISNGKIILRDNIIPSGTLLVEEGKIIAAIEGDADFETIRAGYFNDIRNMFSATIAALA
jgi:hypothetical protein